MGSRFILATIYCLAVFGNIRAHPNIANDQSVDLPRSKRASEKNVVEVVIAVDQGMVDYYGEDLEDIVKSTTYLLSDVYEKSNLDQSITVSLAEIIRLPFEPSEGADSPGAKDDGKNGGTMLGKFCDYVKGNMSIKYDAAMYITRSNIYTNTNPPYGINGLGEMGTMCTRQACLILSDSFLSTSWVAAHELGHVFGAPHDEDASCASYTQPEGKVLMTAAVGQAWSWSDCSKNIFEEFFKKDVSKCLLEQTSPNMIESYKIGANKDLWSASRQCKEWLKEEFNTQAPFREYAKECNQMWCPGTDGYDHSNGAPFSDGTPCAENKVCKHMECMDAN